MQKPKEKTKHDLLLEITRKNVLALDIAQHCGYYSTHERGTWNFVESKKRNNNKEHGAFRAQLIEFIQKYDIKLITAEDVNVNRHFTDMRKLSEFRGVLLEVCDTLDLPEPIFIPVQTIKKFATGNGNAKKDEMIEAMIYRYGIEPIDDNEADACHIFHYCVRKYNID